MRAFVGSLKGRSGISLRQMQIAVPVEKSLLNRRAKIFPEWSTSVEADIEADL